MVLVVSPTNDRQRTGHARELGQICHGIVDGGSSSIDESMLTGD